jgi:hypothetical protein
MSRLRDRDRCRRDLRRLPQGMRYTGGLGLTCTQESAETAGLSLTFPQESSRTARLSLTLNLWELLEVTTVAKAVDQLQMSRLNPRCRCRRDLRRLPQELRCAGGLGLTCAQESGSNHEVESDTGPVGAAGGYDSGDAVGQTTESLMPRLSDCALEPWPGTMPCRHR